MDRQGEFFILDGRKVEKLHSTKLKHLLNGGATKLAPPQLNPRQLESNIRAKCIPLPPLLECIARSDRSTSAGISYSPTRHTNHQF